MDHRRDFLVFEAVLLIAPVALLLVWAIPMTLFAIVFQLPSHGDAGRHISDGFAGYAGIVGGVSALFVLIRLVRKTIREELFTFGVWFWFGISFGLYASHYLYRITNAVTTALVVLPLSILVVHFLIIQLKLRSSVSLG